MTDRIAEKDQYFGLEDNQATNSVAVMDSAGKLPRSHFQHDVFPSCTIGSKFHR
jgi:hypothetical protein